MSIITAYAYKGHFDDVDADYIPCLIGTCEDGEEAYFETLGDVSPGEIIAQRPSKWFSGPTRIIGIKFIERRPDGEVTVLGYALADELMTAGVEG